MFDLFLYYVKLGLFHVLDVNAYDHVIYFIVLTIPYTFKDWKKVLGLVTVFTAGHTLSLLASIYGWISIKSVLVEFLIPLTIVCTAAFNIITAGKSVGNERFIIMYFITTFFGLIHGLGFSNYFKEIVAVDNAKLAPTLEFALGIELAQILVVAAVLALSFSGATLLKLNKKEWTLVVSSVVLGLAIPLLIDTFP
ncbi:HupE/UreJ family protein [Ascidiimonas sp. W6]|uniref:HupE/UreJ family protein n=1 Tax=Ascidiimonas meishanensis TaxID=3128903 RepID=UPI0030EB45A5